MAVEREVAEGFDFTGLVRAIVIAHLGKDPEVQDVLTIAAEDTVRDLVDESVADLELVDGEEFDELADRVYQLEEDMDTSDEVVEDLERRMDAVEREMVFEEDFENAEQDLIKLQEEFNKYRPLLEMLSKIEPVLRMLGLVHDQKARVYKQHPKYVASFHHAEEPRPVQPNWRN